LSSSKIEDWERLIDSLISKSSKEDRSFVWADLDDSHHGLCSQLVHLIARDRGYSLKVSSVISGHFNGRMDVRHQVHVRGLGASTGLLIYDLEVLKK